MRTKLRTGEDCGSAACTHPSVQTIIFEPAVPPTIPIAAQMACKCTRWPTDESSSPHSRSKSGEPWGVSYRREGGCPAFLKLVEPSGQCLVSVLHRAGHRQPRPGRHKLLDVLEGVAGDGGGGAEPVADDLEVGAEGDDSDALKRRPTIASALVHWSRRRQTLVECRKEASSRQGAGMHKNRAAAVFTLCGASLARVAIWVSTAAWTACSRETYVTFRRWPGMNWSPSSRLAK